MSYLHARLELLCLTLADITMTVPRYDGFKFVENTAEERVFFTESKKGDNIDIHYFRLNGSPYEFKPSGAKWGKHFTRTRLKTPVHGGDGKEHKYIQPNGSGKCPPFFTKLVIEKYIAKKEIDTLYIVEGEIKAYVASINGIDCIGIGGIHGFYDFDNKKLHTDIVELCKECKVKNLVLLHDADARLVEHHESKDLHKRLNAFYTSVNNFREATKLTTRDLETLKDVYYMHIKKEFVLDGKGIDDLLLAFSKSERKKIVKDLRELSFCTSHFDGINLLKEDSLTLRNFFGIASVGNFSKTYADVLTDTKFKYNGSIYYYNGSDVELEEGDRYSEYMRVESKWYRKIQVPCKLGTTTTVLKSWNVSEIERDLGKKVTSYIKKYKTFVNYPENDPEKYEQVIDECYNLYERLPHELVNGDISNTISFIKHIFGGKGSVKVNTDNNEYTYEEEAITGDTFTIALDYLTLQYQRPTQLLPVPCLVSRENETGKSTFLKWLREIYGNNATILGNEEFAMAFNSHYITKYIIGIDETFVDGDKKSQKERLKKLATDDKQFLQFKGSDVQEIDFYGKIIICSNDEEKFMKMEKEEVRWFVIKPPVIKEKNPLLLEAMRRELPAFLNYIKNREVYHPNKSRAWFDPELIKTDQRNIVVNSSKLYYEEATTEFIKEHLTIYKKQELLMTVKHIVESINKTSKYKIAGADVKKFLKTKGLNPSEKVIRHKVPVGFISGLNNELNVREQDEVGTPYNFKASEWLTDAELADIDTPMITHSELELQKEDLPF